jgi:hypothetical protein
MAADTGFDFVICTDGRKEMGRRESISLRPSFLH